MWLRAGSNTNDPKVIYGYYLEALKEVGGPPHTICADRGTENVNIEQAQTLLSALRSDANEYILPPFLCGTSPSNQRIESWWSILRMHHAQFWLNLFHKFRDDGIFDGTFLDKSLIQFYFMKIIQVTQILLI